MYKNVTVRCKNLYLYSKRDVPRLSLGVLRRKKKYRDRNKIYYSQGDSPCFALNSKVERLRLEKFFGKIYRFSLER